VPVTKVRNKLSPSLPCNYREFSKIKVRFRPFICYVKSGSVEAASSQPGHFYFWSHSMNRTERRAAERKANKLANKAADQSSSATGIYFAEPQPTVAAPVSSALSPARVIANQANAQLSTGPRTPEGKAKVSLNAVKTALTGVTVLLPTDDAVQYEQFVARYLKRFKPVGVEEETLVQLITDSLWRMLRIPSLEAAIWAKGLLEFADAFDHRPEAERPALIRAEILLKYEKQFKNLHIQEQRLASRRAKELIELSRLQEARIVAEQESAKNAAKTTPKVIPSTVPAHVGFEFSTVEMPTLTSTPKIQTAEAAY
jgi:hypothetical protein